MVFCGSSFTIVLLSHWIDVFRRGFEEFLNVLGAEGVFPYAFNNNSKNFHIYNVPPEFPVSAIVVGFLFVSSLLWGRSTVHRSFTCDFRIFYETVLPLCLRCGTSGLYVIVNAEFWTFFVFFPRSIYHLCGNFDYYFRCVSSPRLDRDQRSSERHFFCLIQPVEIVPINLTCLFALMRTAVPVTFILAAFHILVSFYCPRFPWWFFVGIVVPMICTALIMQFKKCSLTDSYGIEFKFPFYL